MLTFIIGFTIGLLFFPLMYYLSPRIVVEINQRKMLKINNKNKDIELTDGQAMALVKSMHKCTDVHWLNAIIQRFYLELSRSYATESRMRMTILKKFEALKANGYIKNVEITGIFLGKEAPYVESIQIVSERDVKKMVLNGDYNISDMKDEEEKLRKLENEIREGLELEHEIFRRETGGIIDDEPNETIRGHEFGFGKELGHLDGDERFGLDCSVDASKFSGESPEKNEARKTANPDKVMLSREVFDRLQILANVNYKGGIRIALNLELPKKITVKVSVFVNGFHGDTLMRLPSNDYDTRCEYCFLSNPNLIIRIESGICNATGRLYFRKSISGFLERYIKQLMLKTMVYPSWNTQYLPFVIPSIRNITHNIEKVTPENHSTLVPRIVADILLYSSMDYRITAVKDGVVYRRINYFVNGDGRILYAHFSIPKTSLRTSHFASRNLFFRGLTVQESKIMNQFYDWTVFLGIISSFRELWVKANFGNMSLVKLVFENSQYEFIRLVVGNSLIFQRNDPESPEFLVFKISDEVLHIYQYITTDQLLINKRRINKLRRKFDLKPATTLGLVSLCKLMRFSKRTALSYFKETALCPEEQPDESKLMENKDEIEKTELVEIFEDIKKSIDSGDYVSKKICSKASLETIYRVLAQDDVRIKLFSEECNIYTVVNETENIRSIVVENKASCLEKNCMGPSVQAWKETGNFEMSVRTQNDFVVHSYFGAALIIDLRIHDLREVFIYRIIPMEENSYGYRSKIILLYSNTANITFPNYFIEAFQLRIRQDEYLSIAESLPYETSLLEREFRKEVYVAKGAIYIEFYTEISDDYSFILHSANNGGVAYDIYKVITSRRARIILPVLEERDVMTVIITPKFGRNRYISHKFISLPGQFHTETLIDCNIGLSKNMKFYCPITGNTDCVIFWEKEGDEDIKAYIEDDETRVVIAGNGSMRTDNKRYQICYKNKGEKKREIRIFVGLYLKKSMMKDVPVV